MSLRFPTLSLALLGISVAPVACSSGTGKRVVIPEEAGADAASGGAQNDAGPGAGGTPTGGGGSGGAAGAAGNVNVPDASTDAGPEAGEGLDASVPSLFVDPALGNDASDGTRSSPFKNLSHAITVAGTLSPGQTIFLAPGTYDSTNQTTLSFTVPAGTTLRGSAPGAVKIVQNAASQPIFFTGGGGLIDLDFDSLTSPISVSGTGNFSMSGVHFTNTRDALGFKGSVVATIDASGSQPLVGPTTNFGLGAVSVDENAQVTVNGGTFDGTASSAGGAIFFTRGHGSLRLVGTTITNSPSKALIIYDDADVILDSVTISGMQYSSSGLDQSIISMGGQNTLQPLDPSLTILNSTIGPNQATAIALSLYGNIPATPIIDITGSHIDGNTGYGIQMATPGTADPGLTVTLTATNTTFSNNGKAGISTDIGTIAIQGGEISGNGEDGIIVNGVNFISSLKMRGTKLDKNTLSAVSFRAAAGSMLDLGKTGDTGGLVFTNVPSGQAAVNLGAAIQGFAVGNTWLPNIQGADATGHFASPLTIAASTTGQNATTAAGATLVVMQ